MKTKEIFDLSIKLGIDSDFRGTDGVQKLLNKRKKKYDSLTDKEYFDIESLTNPYLDSRIHNISEDKEIKKVLAGIDVDTAELLLAKQLGDIDLVIAHHPVGKALASLGDIMELQADVYNYYGVPINVAESLNRQKISEVSRGVSASNQQKSVDSAKILGINFMNSHTPADNLVAKFLKDLIEKENPETIEDVLNLLKEVPEYKEASLNGCGPKAITGSPENRCGKISITEITGGTEGSSRLMEALSQAGIGTTIAMHASEDHRKKAEASHVNIVIAGHISSDSLGMNLFLDELEKRGVEVVCFSGLTRVKRI
ncbi:MAG: NGG1p interacting factor NIF3 [Candidatus Pacebacteria bacterium]|nr:NGG1p interacting factor NIF3 [Candidatus Paceibacterota bacterium]MDD4074066.1 NGG1p interacting factor NIF3 [Candidatus Paceibacterota bacterium]